MDSEQIGVAAKADLDLAKVDSDVESNAQQASQAVAGGQAGSGNNDLNEVERGQQETSAQGEDQQERRLGAGVVSIGRALLALMSCCFGSGFCSRLSTVCRMLGILVLAWLQNAFSKLARGIATACCYIFNFLYGVIYGIASGIKFIELLFIMCFPRWPCYVLGFIVIVGIACYKIGRYEACYRILER